MTWTFYGDPLFRYRDDQTGRFVSQQTIWAWSDDSAQSNAGATAPLAEQVADKTLSVDQWQQEMRDRIKAEYIRQFELGSGGRVNITPSGWGAVGGMLAEQYRYLDAFAAEIAAGELSEAQIRARSAMYILSAREAYERASAMIRGIPTASLPAFPADGTSCLGLTRCGCNWRYVYRQERNLWECYWELGAREHCELCLQHASEWNPFIVEL